MQRINREDGVSILLVEQNAALALAISSRTDVTFVLAVHVLRVVMLMLVMPIFVRVLRRW
jgi:uncharacterized membrane protein AbrB (regulator of aidB expression)